MIEEFIASWPLFQNTYLAGVLIGVLLSILGVVVVARDQIFIGAAISQASIVGLTVGMLVGHYTHLSDSGWYEFDPFVSILGGLFAVLGALATTRAGDRLHASRESVTGWVFLFGMSFSVLLVAHSPHGLEEVHRLVTSTLIGARWPDVVIFSLMAAATVAVFLRWHREIVLVVMDPDMARAVGLRVGWWDRGLYIGLGFAVAFSLRVSGMVYTFGYLILPALIAKSFCREVRSTLAIAPVVAVLSASIAFVVAHSYDLPPAHVAVGILVGVAAVASLVAELRERGDFGLPWR